MGICIRRLVHLAWVVAALVPASSAVARAQIPLGELWRPEVGVRDFFGESMGCDDATLVVSVDRGVDVFEVVEDGARWVQELRIEEVDQEGVEPYSFYDPVVLGDWLAVKDSSATVNGVLYAGAVHVFRRDRGRWQYAQSLVANEPIQQGDFGRSLDLDGTTLAIGSPDEDSQRGAAHLYELRGGTWTLVQTLEGLLIKTDFGSGVSVDGRWLLVGAADESGWGPKGHVHFFERTNSDPLAPWVLRQSFEGPGEWISSWFGYDLLVRVPHAVSADSGDPNIGVSPSLGVVTYELASDGVWHETGLLLEPETGFYGPNSLFFGTAMSLRGDDLLIGSPLFTELKYEGAVFRYRLVQGTWEYSGKLAPATPKPEGRFGQAIVHAPGLVFASAPWKDITCTTPPLWGFDICYAKGTVHVFRTVEDATQFCSCPIAAPCGNPDNHGGCANLKGFGGVLASGGTGSVRLDDLELKTWSLPAGAPVLLLVGQEATSKPFGDGQLCVAEPLLRLASQRADDLGAASFGPGLVGSVTGAGYPALPGTSGTFQIAYRDPPGPCGSGINLTNAVRVDFKP